MPDFARGSVEVRAAGQAGAFEFGGKIKLLYTTHVISLLHRLIANPRQLTLRGDSLCPNYSIFGALMQQGCNCP